MARQPSTKNRKKVPAGGSPEAFYDALAGEYDLMTDFHQRFVTERPFFRLIVERYRIRTALDAGCGTGFHSMLLSQLGVEVTGVDISAEMIRAAEAHAHNAHASASFVRAGLGEVSQKIRGRFDAVFCLGNTLAHAVAAGELGEILRGFRSLLKPGGLLLIQNLNYDRILAARETVQSVKEKEGTIFVRYYEFQDAFIRFNILRLYRREGAITYGLESVPLRPMRRDELAGALDASGFTEIRVHGGISLQPFDAVASTDIVLLATR